MDSRHRDAGRKAGQGDASAAAALGKRACAGGIEAQRVETGCRTVEIDGHSAGGAAKAGGVHAKEARIESGCRMHAWI